MYSNLLPSKEENIFNQNMLVVFPNRDQLGRRVLLLELGSMLFWFELKKNCILNQKIFLERWKHKEVTLDEVFKGCVLFLEAAMLEPETQVNKKNNNTSYFPHGYK